MRRADASFTGERMGDETKLASFASYGRGVLIEIVRLFQHSRKLLNLFRFVG